VARGDPVFTKFDNASRHSHKLQALQPEERWVYAALNMVCTEELQDVLLSTKYGLKYVAREANVNVRIAKRALLHMAHVRLIELTDKWSVFVYDVRERHRRLRFKERPIWPPNGETLVTHMGKDPDPYGAISEFRDQKKIISTDPDTEIVTQRTDPAQPIRPGAVDIKSLLQEAEQESDLKRAAEQEDPVDTEPWNEVKSESEDERDIHLWFMQLWPAGEYEWEAEKDSVLSQYRKYGRNAYAYARAILIEHRKEGKLFRMGELAYLNGIAREQAKKCQVGR
jgi:hypothetical protein